MARETKTQLQERLEYESIIIKYDTKKTRRNTGRKEIGITGNYTLFDIENLIKETCWII